MNYREFLDEILRLNPSEGRRAIKVAQELARSERMLLVLDTIEIPKITPNDRPKPISLTEAAKLVKKETDRV